MINPSGLAQAGDLSPIAHPPSALGAGDHMASAGTTSMASKRRLPIANSDWDGFGDYRSLFAPSIRVLVAEI